MKHVRAACIIGVGLIGGSLGMAWRRTGRFERLIGVVRRPERAQEAVAAGAVDEATTDLAAAVREADLCVFCTPVETIVPLVQAALPHMRPDTIVTDAGSTKGAICQTLWQSVRPPRRFIGGHPMAGSERGGLQEADPYLFEQAAYVLCPPQDGDDDELEMLTALVRDLGAHPLILDPRTHDTIIAAVSHLPYLVATALVNTAGRYGEEADATLRLAAGGFRDTTRVASSPPELWRDICLNNRSPILALIEQFGAALDELRAALADADSAALERLFAEAASLRDSIPSHAKGILSSVYEMVVHLVDRPGAIADVAQRLGEANINIIDIEILRVREGDGGTVRLAVETPESLEAACSLLREAGYDVRARS